MNPGCKEWRQNCAHYTSLKNSLRRPEGHVHVRDPPSQPCSDGKGAKTAGERCHWKPKSLSCMQAVQDIGRLIVDPKTTTSLGSTLDDQAAFSRESTGCSTWRGEKKRWPNQSSSSFTKLANRGQRASIIAVEK